MRTRGGGEDDRYPVRGKAIVEGLLVFAVYLALVLASYRFAYLPDLRIAAVWPPSGVSLAVLVLRPLRRWPSLAAAFFFAVFFGLLDSGAPIARIAVFSLADVAEPLAGATLIRHFLPTTGLSLHRPAEVLLLVGLGGIVGPLIGTAVALLGLVFTDAPIDLTLFTAGWWASAFLGVIGVAPILFAGLHVFPSDGAQRALEGAGIVATTIVLLAFGFAAPIALVQFAALALAAFPLLAWPATRFGAAGAAWAAAIVSGVSVFLTVHDVGPFSHLGAPHLELLAAQGFFALATVSALLLGAAFDERRHLFRCQEVLAQAGAILASFGPLTERLQRALQLTVGSLGETVVLRQRAVPAHGDDAILAAGELRSRDRARVVDTPEATTQRCGEQGCWLLVPLRPIPEGGGHLAIRALRRRHYFDRGEVALVEGFAHRIALALEQERLAREAERLYHEAQEAIRLRDQFLSIASHELKTPLTPLAARLDLLRRRAMRGLPIDVDTIDKAKASLGKLTWLINDLLDVSRIQAGGLSLHRRPMPFAAAVGDVMAALRPSDLQRIRFRPPREDFVVSADRHRLEQVVANLIDNALKYSPKDSDISVRLERKNGEVWLSVEDRGPGIPAAEQERLFDRLFRGHRAAASRIGGLGLGLYIVRDIVERHGGRVWVESEEGRGSTFRVALPLFAQEQAPAPSESPAKKP